MSTRTDIHELTYNAFLSRYNFPNAIQEFHRLQANTPPPTRLIGSAGGTGANPMTLNALYTGKAMTVTAIAFNQPVAHASVTTLTFTRSADAGGGTFEMVFTGSVTLTNLYLPDVISAELDSSTQASVNVFGFPQP